MAELIKKTKNYKPILLENEKSEKITKVKNDLGAWGFFKYLYSKSMLKLLGLNMIMLLFLVPVYLVSNYFNGLISNAVLALPYSNTFGLGIAPWGGIAQYLTDINNTFNTSKYLFMLVCIPLVTVAVSGGFAVIRDAYWTGELKVFKTFFKGVYQTGLKILPFAVVIAGGFLGIHFFTIAVAGMAAWLSTMLTILLYVVLALFAMLGIVFSGVVTLYNQSYWKSLKASVQLTARYIVSNLFTMAFSIAPFVLMALNIYMVYILVITLIFMFGMIYFGLLWMVHLMRVCGSHTVEISNE